MLYVLAKVFRRPSYALLALLVSVAVLSFSVWLPNVRLLQSFFESDASLTEKLQFALTLLGSIQTNFTTLSAVLTILIAVLSGIYVALLTYLVRERILLSRANLAASTGGVISGLFGVGCTACGSFLVTTLFGWAGVSAFIQLLPFKGAEFGLLGAILLLVALYFTVRQLKRPLVCDD